MWTRRPLMACYLWGGALAVAAILVCLQAAYPFHGPAPKPLPPGHGQLMIRLVGAPSDPGPMPEGQVRIEGLEVHRKGSAPGTWERLPLLRTEFAPLELLGGQVWLVDVPLPAGEFDQVRMGTGRRSQISVALRLLPGKWSILSLEVRFQATKAGESPRLALSGARTTGPY